MSIHDRKRLARRALATARTFEIAGEIYYADRLWRARIAILRSQLADGRGIFGYS